MLALVETYVDELEVAYILGEVDCLRTDGMVDDMVALDIVDGVDKLVLQLFEDFRGDEVLVDELAEGVAVYVVGYDTSAERGHFLQIVDHHDIGVGEVVAHVKLLLEHLTELLLVGIFRLESLEHHPAAILLCGIDKVVLLLPFGEQGDLGPFFRRRRLYAFGGVAFGNGLRLLLIVAHREQSYKFPFIYGVGRGAPLILKQKNLSFCVTYRRGLR